MDKPHIGYESWVALDSKRLLTEGEAKRMSMPWRLWEIALSKVNNYGHAAFHKDELVRLACGEVTRANRAAVYRGMKILAQMGRIAPVGEKGSTLLCIMINEDIGKRRAGKGNYTYLCAEITHMDIRQTPYTPDFSAAGAVDYDPEWDDSWSQR